MDYGCTADCQWERKHGLDRLVSGALAARSGGGAPVLEPASETRAAAAGPLQRGQEVAGTGSQHLQCTLFNEPRR